MGGGAHAGGARSASRKHSGVGEGGVGAPPEGIGRYSRGLWCPLTSGGSLSTHALSSPSITAIQAGLRAKARLLTGLEERGGGLLQTVPTIHLERESESKRARARGKDGEIEGERTIKSKRE